MAAPSVSNISQLSASDASTWNSGTVGNADGSIADLNVSVEGINPPNTTQNFENSSSGTTSGQKYSAYSPSWTAVDISAANQAILFHFAGDPGQFNRVSTDSDGITMYAFDSGGSRATNYRRWELGGSGDKFYAGAGVFFPVLLFSAGATAETGTLDETDIVEIGVAWKAADTGQYGVAFKIDQIVYINGEVSLDGGDGTTVATWSEYYDLLKPDAATGTVYNSSIERIKPFYGWGYPILVNSVNFSDSNFTFAFLPADSAAAFNPPSTGYYSLTIAPTTATSTLTFTDGVFAYDSGTYPLDIDATNLTTGTMTMTRCSFLNAGAVTIDGSQLTMSACTITSPASCSIANADLDLAINNCTADIQWTADLAANSTIETDSNIDITFAETDLSDITITMTASATVTVSPTTGSGEYDLTGLTTTGTVTLDNATANNTTVVLSSGVTNSVASPTTGGGTITVSQPTTDFTLNSSEASSDIRIFTTGTQTELASGTGTQVVYTHTGQTVDYTVQKAGFLPQRVTGLVLSGNVTVTVNLVADPVYDASHGLTYTTDASWSRASNQLTVPTFGPTVRQVYSLMIDSFISESALRNTAFNISMNGPTSMFLTEDAEGASDASIENMTDGGVRYVTSADATAAEWSGVQSIGTATGFTGEYQQVDGSGTTDARATGAFDELIKVYGDATHGNFDYRGHLVLKYQVNGYREERVDVLDTYGISTLEPTLYVVAMEPVAITAATGDPAITITITDHGASPVAWNGKNFGITITDSAGGNTAENILRELNYNLSLDATYQGKDPFNWPEMVKELGSGYDTIYGYTEGAQSSTLKGVRVVQNDGTTAHAGFTRFQSDDGTYYTPATVASISAPNLTDGRIQIYNSTGAGASSWAATTAYSLGNYVLRTTGKGTELGDGVFFVCTTAGTSGGTEPTWDVAANGNTTADGTVTWTVRPVEFDNTTTTSGYSNSWTDGEEFASGDTIRLRWTDEDNLEILATGLATAEGTTSFLDTPEDDTVYDGYAIDGSTVTEYSADYPNIQVDITDPDNVFYIDRFYAWHKYNVTTADGIRNFFGAVTATNTSNITINNTVVDIYFDNTKTVSARQGDQIVIQRADGAYPQVTNTSGGGGLGFYYTGIGYSTSSGSGLDTTERNKLLGLYDFDPTTNTVEGSETYQEAIALIRAQAVGKVAVSGTTVTFRDAADSKDRITATVDSDGQRTSVTVDGA